MLLLYDIEFTVENDPPTSNCTESITKRLNRHTIHNYNNLHHCNKFIGNPTLHLCFPYSRYF